MAHRPDWPVPDGYVLRNFRPGDEEAYIALMHAAGFEDWTRETLDDVVERAVPNGVVFAEHAASSLIAATAMGWYKPNELFPDAHEMGWVAALPEHQGHGLGRVVTAAATWAVMQDGAKNIYLLTDDWRLPAIKSYLQVGYVPFYSEPEIEKRWKAIFASLAMKQSGLYSIQKS